MQKVLNKRRMIASPSRRGKKASSTRTSIMMVFLVFSLVFAGYRLYQFHLFRQAAEVAAQPAMATIEVPVAPEGAPNDPLFMAQWGLYEESIGWLRAKQVMDRNFPGGLVPDANSPVIAIIDTSFERHEDLGDIRLADGRMYRIQQTGETTRKVVEAGNAEAPDGYGIASMGIAAAAVDNNLGIAGSGFGVVKVMPIGTGLDTRGIWSAFDFIIEQKERNKAKIAVVSMSLTNPQDVFKEHVEKLKKLGVVVVVASGNNGHDLGVSPQYSAASPVENIVAVAELVPGIVLSDSSNYGRGINIAAPGGGNFTLGLGNGYVPGGGASLSAPYVSGVLAAGVALYNCRKREGLSYDELSAPQLINLLYSTANTAPSLAGKVQNGRYINVGRFIEAVEKARDDAIRGNGKNSVPGMYPGRGVSR